MRGTRWLFGGWCGLVATAAAAASAVDLDVRFNATLNPALYNGIGRGSTIAAFDSLAGGTSFDAGRGIVVLPDGKYLGLALINPGPSGRVGLLRLNADGSRDASFGDVGNNGQILRHAGVLSVAGPVLYGNTAYYAFSSQEGGYGRVTVCRVFLDGSADTSFRSWGWGNSWPAGCSIASSASSPAYAPELGDLDVQPGTGWVVTALAYNQTTAPNPPSDGAFTLMDAEGRDTYANTSFDSPVFHVVGADGEYEVARRVRFSRAAGALPHDFFLALDYVRNGGDRRRVQVRRYDAVSELQRYEAGDALGDVSVGALAVETGPGTLGFDNALLLVLNRAPGADAYGPLFKPALQRVPIDQASGALRTTDAVAWLADDLCDAAAAVLRGESCLVLDAAYDALRGLLWFAGSWRVEGGARFEHVLLGRFVRTADSAWPGGFRYSWPAIPGLSEPYVFQAFNGTLNETRRHWGAALLLDQGRPVVIGDRQYEANDPGNVDHDVLVMRFVGPDYIFASGMD